MNDPQQNLLLIKYIHNCINDFENNFINQNDTVLYLRKKENLARQELNDKKELLNDVIDDKEVMLLIESETNFINEFDRENSQDREKILSYLKNINIKNSFDTVKHELNIFLEQLKFQNIYFHQLSGFVYGSLLANE
jgi:hypothetical protein